jgi:hypothetical protein
VTDLQMWNLVIGFVSATFVLPVIQQPTWRAQTRALVTFLYSVVVGLGAAYLTGAFNGVHDVQAGVSAVLFTFVTAIATYKGFAKPTGIAPVIEDATSPTPSVTDPPDIAD